MMEVSSQAYLKNRVYGLRYDVGAFLNISPDHIGPNEHPTFEDYLAHKLMLLDHSDEVIVNAETDHFDTIYTYAKKTHHKVYTYSRQMFTSEESAIHESRFTVVKSEFNEMLGSYRLNVPGDFNESNAMAAMMLVSFAGVKHQAMVKLSLIHISEPTRP